MTWADTLPYTGGWGWHLTATAPTGVTTPRRGATLKGARRLTKKAGRLTVVAGRGRPWSTKPVGTRMGKGKGKTADHRGWIPRGGAHLRWVGRPGRLAPLTRRCPGVRITPLGW